MPENARQVLLFQGYNNMQKHNDLVTGSSSNIIRIKNTATEAFMLSSSMKDCWTLHAKTFNTCQKRFQRRNILPIINFRYADFSTSFSQTQSSGGSMRQYMTANRFLWISLETTKSNFVRTAAIFRVIIKTTGMTYPLWLTLTEQLIYLKWKQTDWMHGRATID